MNGNIYEPAARRITLFPVCNKDRYIQGFANQLDVDDDRYRWFSTNESIRRDEASPLWVHGVGDYHLTRHILLKERLKLMLQSVLSGGSLFIAIAGVNAVNCLSDTLNQLNVKKCMRCSTWINRSITV